MLLLCSMRHFLGSTYSILAVGKASVEPFSTIMLQHTWPAASYGRLLPQSTTSYLKSSLKPVERSPTVTPQPTSAGSKPKVAGGLLGPSTMIDLLLHAVTTTGVVVVISYARVNKGALLKQTNGLRSNASDMTSRQKRAPISGTITSVRALSLQR